MWLVLQIVLLSLFQSTSAFAWDSANQKWFHDFANRAPRFPNSYAASVWGSFQFPVSVDPSRAYEAILSENGYVEFETSLFRSGGIECPLYFQQIPGSERKASRSPLVILFPGIFEEGRSLGTRYLAESLWSRGYHVAILPNPWSVSYIRRKPVARPGNIAFEANVGLRFVHAAIERLGVENITSVSVVGQSYGSLLGAAVVAMDQDSEHPVITGSTLLISPPLGLKRGALQLDAGISRNEAKFKSCGTVSIFWNALRRIVFGAKAVQNEFSAQLLNCMEPMLFRTFRNHLVDAAGAIRNSLDAHFFDEDPDFIQDEWRYTPRAKGMRFMRAFVEFVPENLPLLQTQEMRLAFWLNQLEPPRLEKLGIISAKDDFLNLGQQWTENDSPAFGAKNLFLLPWGGHMGFMGTPEFQEFLTLNYGSVR